jgi:AcrR family transcriptional regulator
VGQTAKPRRGAEATRTAILDAARECFAAEGYQGATIRAIAADAEIDPALVMRHFGSKERLFAAAASFDLHLPELTALPRKRLGAELVAHFLERWEGDDTLKALLRAAVSNKAAAARLRTILDKQLVAAMLPLFPSRSVAAERAGLVASQMLGLALTRYLLRLPPVVALDRAAIIEWLGPTIQRYLSSSDVVEHHRAQQR